MEELEDRSGGWRESAAILCGRVVGADWMAETVRFHHHLCDDRGRPLSMHLTEDAKFRLYEELNRAELRLIAAIHTHPHEWVELSWIDQRNQICSRKDFWSIVAPWYGKSPWKLEDMGIHIRTGDGWGRLTVEQVRSHVRIEGASWNHTNIE
ncbi:MAG: hypothetical protein LAO06_21640 [Acidobacteriia bacterium]|nr:hypothetical protein [Terriglobia bacterium]